MNDEINFVNGNRVLKTFILETNKRTGKITVYDERTNALAGFNYQNIESVLKRFKAEDDRRHNR